MKFSHERGSVQVGVSSVDDLVWQVTVTDQVIGIEESDLPRLFSLFAQLCSGNMKAHGGTGIGLTLVRLIAKAQGGRIDVRSRSGQGSKFILSMPRVLAACIGLS